MDQKKPEIRTNMDILSDYASKYPVDVVSAAKEMGATIHLADLDNISGVIRIYENGEFNITLNRNDSKERQRFTLAHELGHYMYHRSLIGDGVSDSAGYRSPDESVYANTPLEPYHETQANRFAANLLMPKNLIRKIQASNPNVSVLELAQLFEVSEDAMRIRMGKKTKKQKMFEALG